MNPIFPTTQMEKMILSEISQIDKKQIGGYFTHLKDKKKQSEGINKSNSKPTLAFELVG